MIVALALVAAVERLIVGARARRWKEYGAWVVMSALGAAFGACNDLITSRVSVHYFELGKGLSSVDHQQFVRDVADLGARAGCSAGLLLGGVLLLANGPRPSLSSLRVVELLTYALVPIALAAAFAPIAAFSTDWDLQGLGGVLREVLSKSDVDAFLFVQRAHAGAYIGSALGTTIACSLVVRRRRARRRGYRSHEGSSSSVSATANMSRSTVCRCSRYRANSSAVISILKSIASRKHETTSS